MSLPRYLKSKINKICDAFADTVTCLDPKELYSIYYFGMNKQYRDSLSKTKDRPYKGSDVFKEGIKRAYGVSTSEQREKYKSWLKKQKIKIGIYFLYKDNKIVYVGQSVNIEDRIKAHFGNKDFNSYDYELCDRGELIENTINPGGIHSTGVLGAKPQLNKRDEEGQRRKELINIQRIVII